MKVAVLIPYRNDRHRFLTHLKYMLSKQTRQPDVVLYMDYTPESAEKDITQRYRRGYESLRGHGIDCIFFCEVDDWYSPAYIETMLTEWERIGKPDLFGTNYTIYYHIRLFAYHTMHHNQRSSAMSTMIRPDLTFPWCVDTEPYTDTHLWMMSGLKGQVWKPPTHICLGIKHGVGMTGGAFHTERLQRYTTGTGVSDSEKTFLRSVCDPESFEFYSTYFETEPQPTQNMPSVIQ